MSQSCPLCAGSDGLLFFERSNVPLSANLLFPTREAALAAPSGRLSVCVCRACGFIFNAAFDPHATIYGVGYDNDLSFSTRFDAHLRMVAEHVWNSAPKDLRVLEVGCGQGQFLDTLLETNGCGMGLDPSLRRGSNDRMKFIGKYLGECGAEALAFEANIAVSRHVIEHIQRPTEFLRTLRGALREGALLFLETPCILHILETGAFWDICYEHCSYFSEQTLRLACRRAGFGVRRVERVFSGQYLLLEGMCGQPQEDIPTRPPMALIERFRGRTQALISHWRDAITSVGRLGRVAIWGGATKGASFAQLVDPEAAMVHAIIDINPRKQGHYLAGTGHPIVDWRDAIAAGVRTAIVMNPNYVGEIREMTLKAGVSLSLLSAESHANAAR